MYGMHISYADRPRFRRNITISSWDTIFVGVNVQFFLSNPD